MFESLSLSALVRERIPTLTPRVVVLPRRRAQLVFRERRDRLRAGLTYLGTAAGGARFVLDVERLGHVDQQDFVTAGRRELLNPGDKGGYSLMLEVIDADERAARVAVTTTLRVAYQGELGGEGLHGQGRTEHDQRRQADRVRGAPIGWESARSGKESLSGRHLREG